MKAEDRNLLLALAANLSKNTQDENNWEKSKGEILQWASNDSLFRPGDQPSEELVKTAINLVNQFGFPVPTMITVLDGRIIMEWRYGDAVASVEFVNLRKLEITEFLNGRVISCNVILYNGLCHGK